MSRPTAGGPRKLGYRSVWAWDHILLGSKRPFPFLESLSVLASLSATTETVTLGTGVLVLPLRNPVVLAKVTATIDQLSGGRLILGAAAGWYEREFEAVGIPFAERGQIFDRNVEVLKRFWRGREVTGEADGMAFHRRRDAPPSGPAAPSAAPVRRLRRPRPPAGGDAGRRLAHLLLHGGQLLAGWAKILAFAEEAGRDPDELRNVAQLPLCVDDSFEQADARVRPFIDRYFDVAPWSESTPDSAIRGDALSSARSSSPSTSRRASSTSSWFPATTTCARWSGSRPRSLCPGSPERPSVGSMTGYWRRRSACRRRTVRSGTSAWSFPRRSGCVRDGDQSRWADACTRGPRWPRSWSSSGPADGASRCPQPDLLRGRAVPGPRRGRPAWSRAGSGSGCRGGSPGVPRTTSSSGLATYEEWSHLASGPPVPGGGHGRPVPAHVLDAGLGPPRAVGGQADGGPVHRPAGVPGPGAVSRTSP